MDGRYGDEDSREWRLRALIVEDFEDDALLLLRELRKGGYTPDFERVDTREAMSAALEHRTWDVVLCDHSMPKFSSSAALQLLRESGFPDLPFIIVSGRIGEDAAVVAMKSGAQDYIMKDNLTRLNSAIERELREAEGRRERRRAEEKYRSIFENSIEGIFQSTVEGKLVTVNPALARMAGCESPQEMLRKVPVIEDRLYENPSRRRELYEIMRRDGSISGFEARMKRVDDSFMWASFSIQSVLDDSGALVGFEGTIEDITERKNVEENLRAMRKSERRRIARDLHDEALQDLIYALQATRVMKRFGGTGGEVSGDGPPLDGLVEALDRAVGGLRTAIYDLRLEEEERRSLAESVEKLIEVHNSIAPECSVELFVFGDRNRLSAKLSATASRDLLRIIQEALVNVRRHSEARHATIRLGLEGERIGVEVSDDGQGFDPRTKPGMGLTGMRERASALGGKIEINSTSNSGTTVLFEADVSSLPRDGHVS